MYLVLSFVLFSMVQWNDSLSSMNISMVSRTTLNPHVSCVIVSSLCSWINNVYIKAFISTTISIHYSWRGVKNLVNTWWISWVLPIMAQNCKIAEFQSRLQMEMQPNCCHRHGCQRVQGYKVIAKGYLNQWIMLRWKKKEKKN